jgi:hypothetical protein
VQERIANGVSGQWREMSALAAVERVRINALKERCAWNVRQLTCGQLKKPIASESVASAVGHVGIWLEMFPITPEGIHGPLRFRSKGEFTRGNQCVVRMLDATSYISMNSNHYFQSRERPSSIQRLRCIRSCTVGLLALTRVDEILRPIRFAG